jgi:anhydro-N-acetylmuramic acid kinase
VPDLKIRDIALAGSHGQTVRHLPSKKVTLQIGDPGIIAARTGITTVGDFRRSDIGAGGEGAPLSPVFHKFLFGGKHPIAVVNIGGISNVTFLPGDNKKTAAFGFDCGPGNMIIDNLSQNYFDKPYDINGMIAKSGKVIDSVMKKLEKDKFVNSPPPKSSGREYFNEKFITKNFGSKNREEDLITTATEFTAKSIATGIKNYLPKLGKIVLCGGGALNRFLVERIKANMPGISVETSEIYNLPPKIVECAGFALLAVLAADKVRVDLRKTTGARSTVILGKICYA